MGCGNSRRSQGRTAKIVEMTDSRTYKFGESQLTLTFGDITTSEAQVLVSSDDCYLTMSGGVSAALFVWAASLRLRSHVTFLRTM